MNHTYRVVYNEATNTYTAVAENVPARGKSSKSKKALAVMVAAAALQLTAVSAEAATIAISDTTTVQQQLNKNGTATDSAHVKAGSGSTSNAIAIGNNANASVGENITTNAVVIGTNASAVAQSVGTNSSAIAIGHNARAIDIVSGSAIAIGQDAVAQGSTTHADRKNPIHNLTAPVGENSLFLDGKQLNAEAIAIGHGARTQSASVVIGDYAFNRGLGVSIGSAARATGSSSVVIGAAAYADGNTGLAIGRQAVAKGNFAQGIGNVVVADGVGSFAVGHSANATGYRAIAIGSTDINNASNSIRANVNDHDVYQQKGQTNANGQDTMAMMSNATATGCQTVSIGLNSRANGTNDIAFGTGASAGNASALQNATAIGTKANATQVGAIALGTDSLSNNTNTVAIGTSSNATAKDSVAIGLNAKTLGLGSAYPANAKNPASLAIGSNATSSSKQGDVIIGSLSSNNFDQKNSRFGQSTAVGSRSFVLGDQATALGSDTSAIGNSSFAIGGDDFDKAAAALTSALGNYATASGFVEGKYTSLDDTITSKINQLVNASNTTNLNSTKEKFLGSWQGRGPGSPTGSGDNTKAQYVRTAAIGDASIAFGTMAQSGGVSSIAEGSGAISRGDLSIALGAFTDTYGKRSIAIGALAKTSDDKAIDAISIGTNSTVSGNSSIAIGTSNLVTGDFSGAFGDPSIVAGTNSYSVGNNNIIANNTDNAISIGGQNNIGGIAGQRDATTGVVSVAGGMTNMAGANRSMVMGFRNKVFSADDSMVIGNNNEVTAPNVMVLGNSITTADEDAVILGNKSSGSETATSEISATVNGVTYSSFTGTPATSTHYVSVGAKRDERQIKNVAAGKISEDSTDAINGSQLYLIANQITTTTPLFNQENGTVGATTVNNTPNLVNATTVANAINNSGWNVYQGDTTTPANKKGLVNPGDNVVFANGKGTTASVASDGTNTTVIKYEVNKAGVNTTPTNAADENSVTINEAGKVVAPTDGTVADNTFLTAKGVADVVNSSGWVAKQAAHSDDLVKESTSIADSVINPGDNVSFASGKNLALNKTVEKDGNTIFTYGLADNVSLTDKGSLTVGGTKLDNTGLTFVDAAKNKLPNTPSVTLKGIDAGNLAVTNVAGNLAGAKTGTKAPTTSGTAPVLGTDADKVNVNNAATVGDVLNAG